MGFVDYTSAGTYYWTVPTGVTSITAILVGGGAGGNGGGSDGGPGYVGYGGASGNAGQIRTNVVISVTPGTQLTIGVGNYGVGGHFTILSNRCNTNSWVGRNGGASGISGGASTQSATGGTANISCNGTSVYGQNGKNGYGSWPYSGFGSGSNGGSFGSGFGASGAGGGGGIEGEMSGWGGDGGIGCRGYVAFSYADPPPKPVANFSGTPLSGFTPLTVQFTDSSTNTPTSWDWDFGDDVSSEAQNPNHEYTSGGTYTVTLTAGNLGGSDSEIKTNYVSVTNTILHCNYQANIEEV